jgi:hypothetical protein
VDFLRAIEIFTLFGRADGKPQAALLFDQGKKPVPLKT